MNSGLEAIESADECVTGVWQGCETRTYSGQSDWPKEVQSLLYTEVEAVTFF